MDTPYVTRIEDRVHSTQNYARTEFTARFDGTPVLAVAAAQDAGRGRRGREWWTAPRPLFASVAMSAPPAEVVTLVPLLAGIAIHGSLIEQCDVVTELKWPNDVLVKGVKAGGVLSELRDGVVVVGCGLNLWWPEPPAETAAILADDPGPELAREIAADWAGRLIAGIDGLPHSFNRMRYHELCRTVGTNITWRPDGGGRAIGIDAHGAHMVETDSGSVVLRSDEVSHVRPATIASDFDQTD